MTLKMNMLSTDSFFNDQAMRTLVHTQFGGADFGECMLTMSRIPPGDNAAWFSEWRATADRVAAIGDTCAASGHDISAREAYLRAANYYRTANVMLFGAPTAPALIETYERESDCFREFARRAEPALQAIEIPYEDTQLHGYFCPATSSPEAAPTLIVTSGYDSTLYELYFAFVVAANRRGYHCIIFDGPGQGGALIKHGLPMRPDWEQVIRPVVDVALTRPEVDANRIALAGWSLGGYLALRAASGEPRLAACVADPGLMDLWEGLCGMLPGLPDEVLQHPLQADPALFAPYMAHIESIPTLRWKIVQRAFWVHGVDSLPAYLDASQGFSMRNHLESIRCPVFIAQEENDPLAASAPEVYAAIKAPKTLVQFPAAEGTGDHCAILGRSRFLQQMFDWLDDVLAHPTD